MANEVNTLLAADPCLACLSIEQLDQLKLALWAKAASLPLPANLDTILSDSATHGSPAVSDKQRYQMEITKLKDAFGAGKTIAELLEEVKCLNCIDPVRVRGASLLMEAKYLDTV
jgi:hypothetical protein